MTILLLAIGLVGLAAPGFRPATLLRHHPRPFTRLATVSVLAGITCMVLALCLSVATGLLHVEFGHRGTGSDHLAPEGPIGAVLAGGALIAIAGRLSMLAARTRRARRAATPDAWLGTHERAPGHDLIVLPTPEPLAYNLPAKRRTRVVISEGLKAALDDATLRLVIDHELAHARAHDRRTLMLARVLDTLAPIVPYAARTAAAMRVAAERAADEAATGTNPEPRRRLADHLSQYPHPMAVCTSGCGAFRAEQLTHSPTRAPANIVIAICSLLVLGLLASSVLAHATTDISPYLALLGR